MVVISDDEARGFLFSYDKLIGTKAKSETDLENEVTGNDTSVARTRRLFYVTCSRAEESFGDRLPGCGGRCRPRTRLVRRKRD